MGRLRSIIYTWHVWHKGCYIEAAIFEKINIELVVFRVPLIKLILLLKHTLK